MAQLNNMLNCTKIYITLVKKKKNRLLDYTVRPAQGIIYDYVPPSLTPIDLEI